MVRAQRHIVITDDEDSDSDHQAIGSVVGDDTDSDKENDGDTGDHTLIKHEDANKFKCEACPQRFRNKEDWYYHRSKRHRFCRRCNKAFKDYQGLNYHLAFTSKHIACEQCYIEFKSKAGLQAHQKQFHREKIEIRCPGCSVEFSARSAVIQHIEGGDCSGLTKTEFRQHLTATANPISLNSLDPPIQLSGLEEIVTIPAVATTHVMLKKGQTDLIQFGKKQETETTPQKRAIVLGSKFEKVEDDKVDKHKAMHRLDNMHRHWDPGLEAYICPNQRCRKKFRNKSSGPFSLWQHLSSATHDPENYSCPSCGKYFLTSACVAQHTEASDCGFKNKIPDAKLSKTQHARHGDVLQELRTKEAERSQDIGWGCDVTQEKKIMEDAAHDPGPVEVEPGEFDGPCPPSPMRNWRHEGKFDPTENPKYAPREEAWEPLEPDYDEQFRQPPSPDSSSDSDDDWRGPPPGSQRVPGHNDNYAPGTGSSYGGRDPSYYSGSSPGTRPERQPAGPSDFNHGFASRGGRQPQGPAPTRGCPAPTRGRPAPAPTRGRSAPAPTRGRSAPAPTRGHPAPTRGHPAPAPTRGHPAPAPTRGRPSYNFQPPPKKYEPGPAYRNKPPLSRAPGPRPSPENLRDDDDRNYAPKPSGFYPGPDPRRQPMNMQGRGHSGHSGKTSSQLKPSPRSHSEDVRDMDSRGHASAQFGPHLAQPTHPGAPTRDENRHPSFHDDDYNWGSKFGAGVPSRGVPEVCLREDIDDETAYRSDGENDGTDGFVYRAYRAENDPNQESEDEEESDSEEDEFGDLNNFKNNDLSPHIQDGKVQFSDGNAPSHQQQQQSPPYNKLCGIFSDRPASRTATQASPQQHLDNPTRIGVPTRVPPRATPQSRNDRVLHLASLSSYRKPLDDNSSDEEPDDEDNDESLLSDPVSAQGYMDVWRDMGEDPAQLD